MSKLTIAAVNDKVEALASAIETLTLVLQGTITPTIEAQPAIAGSLTALRSTAPKVLDDETFVSVFNNRLAKAIDVAKAKGADVMLGWCFSEAKGRDYILYHSTPRKGVTTLAVVRPDGSIKAMVKGVEPLIEAVVKAA